MSDATASQAVTPISPVASLMMKLNTVSAALFLRLVFEVTRPATFATMVVGRKSAIEVGFPAAASSGGAAAFGSEKTMIHSSCVHRIPFEQTDISRGGWSARCITTLWLRVLSGTLRELCLLNAGCARLFRIRAFRGFQGRLGRCASCEYDQR